MSVYVQLAGPSSSPELKSPKSSQSRTRRCRVKRSPMSRSLGRALLPRRSCEVQRLQRCDYERITIDDLWPRSTNRISHQPPRIQPFTTSQPWRAATVSKARPSVRKPSQPSMKLEMEKQKEKALSSGQIPDDLGLMQETFIMPFGKNRPSWFANFRGRFRLEKKRLSTRIREIGT